jgi:Flp pilus assembly pilin Flp
VCIAEPLAKRVRSVAVRPFFERSKHETAARFHCTRGVTSIEYALIGACIFVVIVASANQVGVTAGGLFDTVARLMSN